MPWPIFPQMIDGLWWPLPTVEATGSLTSKSQMQIHHMFQVKMLVKATFFFFLPLIIPNIIPSGWLGSKHQLTVVYL